MNEDVNVAEEVVYDDIDNLDLYFEWLEGQSRDNLITLLKWEVVNRLFREVSK
jgi:hypothetical protein